MQVISQGFIDGTFLSQGFLGVGGVTTPIQVVKHPEYTARFEPILSGNLAGVVYVGETYPFKCVITRKDRLAVEIPSAASMELQDETGQRISEAKTPDIESAFAIPTLTMAADFTITGAERRAVLTVTIGNQRRKFVQTFLALPSP